jgi:23S rRNA maturation mini-RNase III
MAGVRKRQLPKRDSADQTVSAISQAQFMVRIYAEIVAMDEVILERVRQLAAAQAVKADQEPYLSNLRLILAQMEKVGERIDFWNAGIRRLLEEQLH